MVALWQSFIIWLQSSQWESPQDTKMASLACWRPLQAALHTGGHGFHRPGRKAGRSRTSQPTSPHPHPLGICRICWGLLFAGQPTNPSVSSG